MMKKTNKILVMLLMIAFIIAFMCIPAYAEGSEPSASDPWGVFIDLFFSLGDGIVGTANDLADIINSYGFKILARALTALAVELALAFFISIRRGKQWLWIIAVNLPLQIVLNTMLELVPDSEAALLATVNYFVATLIVFIIKAVIYCLVLDKYTDDDRGLLPYIWYAFYSGFFANIVSMVMLFVGAMIKLANG